MNRWPRWFVAVVVVFLGTQSAFAQWDSWSASRNSQAFRPRLFTERTWYTTPVNCPSMSDRMSWYGWGASLSGTRYYDSVIRSPSGLDASRRWYPGPATLGLGPDR